MTMLGNILTLVLSLSSVLSFQQGIPGDKASAARLQQGQRLSQALAQSTMAGMDSKNLERMKAMGVRPDNLFCSQMSLDGIINREAKEACIRQKTENIRKAENVKNLVLKSTEGSQKKVSCENKYDERAVMCSNYAVMGELNDQPFYKLKLYGGNVVLSQLSNGEAALMVVSEHLNYKVKEAEQPQKCENTEPDAEFSYNIFGQLVDQKGEVISEEEPGDECHECIKRLVKQADALDGNMASCGGCKQENKFGEMAKSSFKFDCSKSRKKKKKVGGKKVVYEEESSSDDEKPKK